MFFLPQVKTSSCFNLQVYNSMCLYFLFGVSGRMLIAVLQFRVLTKCKKLLDTNINYETNFPNHDNAINLVMDAVIITYSIYCFSLHIQDIRWLDVNKQQEGALVPVRLRQQARPLCRGHLDISVWDKKLRSEQILLEIKLKPCLKWVKQYIAPSKQQSSH